MTGDILVFAALLLFYTIVCVALGWELKSMWDEKGDDVDSL